MARPAGPPKHRTNVSLDGESMHIVEQLLREGVERDQSAVICWALKFAFEHRKRKKDIELCEQSIREMSEDIAGILRRLEAVETNQKLMTDATAGAASYLASASVNYNTESDK